MRAQFGAPDAYLISALVYARSAPVDLQAERSCALLDAYKQKQLTFTDPVLRVTSFPVLGT
jgi:hypothetical protein